LSQWIFQTVDFQTEMPAQKLLSKKTQKNAVTYFVLKNHLF